MKEYEILQEIQSQLKAPKNQFNKFGNYNYRNCEDILEALKPILAEKKCAITLSDEVVSVSTRIYIKAIATLVTPEGAITTTAFAREEEDKKGMDGSQITGAASSYARKYALNGLFAIDDTKDSDATNKGDTAQNKGNRKATENKVEEPKELDIILHGGKFEGKTLREIYKDKTVNELRDNLNVIPDIRNAIAVIDRYILLKSRRNK